MGVRLIMIDSDHYPRTFGLIVLNFDYQRSHDNLDINRKNSNSIGPEPNFCLGYLETRRKADRPAVFLDN
jgi:hypothetical protein